MESLRFFLKYARYRYIAYRIFLRIKMGKKERDDFLRESALSEMDFLPERIYSINRIKAIPRKGSDDFYMFYVQREKGLLPHLIMDRGETFVDVGANVRVPIHARVVAVHQRGYHADAEATSMIVLLDI